jgi:preprotein translocase subunit SecF
VLDIIGKRRWYFAFSLAITIPGLIFILLGPITGGKVGLQFAIDFTGGTVWTIRFEDSAVTPQQVVDVFAAQGIEANVTQTGDGFMDIRTKEAALAAPAPTPAPLASSSPAASGSPEASASAGASESPSAPASAAAASPSGSASASASPSAAPSASATPSASPSPAPSASASASPAASAGAVGASPAPSGSTGGALPSAGKLGDIRRALEAELGPIAEQRSLSSVGAVVSSDLITQALMLILIGSAGIMTWITYRFRDFKMGVTALIALLHDVLVVVGIFAILGTFTGLLIDSLFVTAMLTVIGFSVHDTIVVFDRIRENRSRHLGEPFERVVNYSILQTLGRSLTTSFTVIITLLALLLFAGEAIGTFVLALLLGITSGTYSSIFNASPLLVVWHQWEDRRRAAAVGQASRPDRRAAT